MSYQRAFELYIPKNEQESRDKALILQFIKRNPDCLDRSNLTAHITSSAFVINPKMTRVLFAYHHIYDSWAWVGGHNDGNPNLLEVAMKEAKEETGLKEIHPYSNDIFTIDVIQVTNHYKNGAYIPDHLHLNATFLLIADENQPICANPLEHKDVKWFDLDDVFNHVTEKRMISVYQKAFDEIKKYRKKGIMI